MVIKVSDLKKAQVISLDGTQLSSIKDIVYDPTSKKVVALLTTKTGLLSEVTVIPLQEIQKINGSTILVKSVQSEKKVSEYDQNIAQLVKDDSFSMSKKKVISKEAKEFGTSSDVFFDIQTGKLIGFELSQSGTEDTKSEQKTMKIKEIVSAGQDAIIVIPELMQKPHKNQQHQEPPSPQQQLQSPQPQHNESLVDKAKTKMQDFQKKAEEKTKQIQEVAQKKAQEMQQAPDQKQQEQPQPEHEQEPQEPKQHEEKNQEQEQKDPEKPQEQKLEKQPEQKANGKEPDPKVIEEAVGQYITKNILTANDELLAKQGEIVTNEMLRIAYTNGVIDQMLGNISRKLVE